MLYIVHRVTVLTILEIRTTLVAGDGVGGIRGGKSVGRLVGGLAHHLQKVRGVFVTCHFGVSNLAENPHHYSPVLPPPPCFVSLETEFSLATRGGSFAKLGTLPGEK
ncbi:anti-sigma-factor antagonist [Anopheles sinensis]|uniref:Anti-sigma-factor antagonist n=1 Tax=Anopheles sinensis TaxID=74873 RepID=A0A084VHE7_ANOSI|nr:anti-sigma-factor antagonist [Anopheles sinensis]